MYGYKIIPSGIPETVYACTAHIKLDYWENFNTANYIEIGICQTDTTQKTVYVADRCYSIGVAPYLCCIVGNEKVIQLAPADAVQHHLYVSVHYPHLQITACELTDEDFENTDYLLLPPILTDLSPKFHDTLSKLLLQYINYHTSKALSDKLLCESIWNQILVLVDTELRSTHRAALNTPEHLYVRKLERIIADQHAQPLSLKQIAKDFGITSTYLSSLYRKHTGTCFSEALQRTRMHHARQLASEASLSVSEIGAIVGINDERYLRKRFHQFFGISITECRRIDREVTRLHSLELPSNNPNK